MITYKVSDELLHEIAVSVNKLLKLGVAPGNCMDIINGHESKESVLEIYDTGNYNFQVRLKAKK